MASARLALFPGSFDPVTVGHLDLIIRAARLFDRVLVGVLVNPAKQSLFTADERLDMIRQACAGTSAASQVEVASFEGLLVDFAGRVGAVAVIRGLRNGADFDYEQPMIAMNRHLAPSIESVCLVASPESAHISSRLVKEVAAFGGSITGMVPAAVEAQLHARLKGKGRS